LFSAVKLSVLDLPMRKLLAKRADNRSPSEVLADRPADERFFAATFLCVVSNESSFS
jgi:hypothetical protein